MSDLTASVKLFGDAYRSLAGALRIISNMTGNTATAPFSDDKMQIALDRFWGDIQLAMDRFHSFLLKSSSDEKLKTHGIPRMLEDKWVREATSDTKAPREEISRLLKVLGPILSHEVAVEAKEVEALGPEEFIAILNTILKESRLSHPGAFRARIDRTKNIFRRILRERDC